MDITMGTFKIINLTICPIYNGLLLYHSPARGHITFSALVPRFHIQTLTLTIILTLRNILNHTISLTRFQALTRPKIEAFSTVHPSTGHVTTLQEMFTNEFLGLQEG